MCIQEVGLGIRELQRVSDFLNDICHGCNLALNEFVTESEDVTIGYDLSYDSAYVKNESVVLFPEDFE